MPRAEAEPLLAEETTREIAAYGHLEALYDPLGTMTLSDVSAPNAQFRLLPGNFNAGYTPKGAWWLRLSIVSTHNASEAWWLAITAPYTDLIEVYGPDLGPSNQIEIVRKETGSLVPAARRELFTHAYLAQVHLKPNDRTDIYLRLSGTRSLSAKLTLWRLPDLLQHLTIGVLLLSLAVGAAGITSAGALIFGAWLRSPTFLWYGAYAGATALVFLGNSGFGSVLLNTWNPVHVLRLQGVIGCLSIMTGALLIRSIFCVPSRSRIITGFVLGMAGFAGLGMVASAFGFYGQVAPPLILGVLLLSLLVPALAFQQYLERKPAAVWYLVGFGSYSLATVWFALVALGFAPLTQFSEWGYQTIGVLHMGAIFAGLASAMRAGSRERRRLEARLLVASQRNERQLERAVAERTVALNAEIEARRRAETALHKALKEQRNFLVMVSHEFRTPLSTMRLAVAIIERGLASTEERLRNEARKISRAALRLSNLIDTFLAEEWLDKTAMQIQRKPVDLALLLREVSSEQASNASRAIAVTTSAVAVIEADPVLLRAAVENVIGNALKHTEGNVLVSLHTAPDGISLQVEDQGEGIPATEREEIFERYFRSSAAGARPGAGIGLYLAKQIVDLHGGRITLSAAPAGGSIFEIWLPVRMPAEAPQRAHTK
ncbi:sensor histidine kinase [Xanthobacter sp. DSM 24535]|uniref:sensor histidine kinase n=1 Tax=Roseixanthobacter psychrophilus TaxID=3119917 RepID=UPI0037285ECB